LSSYNWIHDDAGLFDDGQPLSRDARRALASLDNICGTPTGWYGHKKSNEVPCSDCEAAHLKQPGRPSVIRATCGTEKGWRDHRWRSELPCPDCIEAKDKADAAKCGSYPGWMLHRRRREAPCAPCTRASAEYQNARLHGRSRLAGAAGSLELQERPTCPVCGRSVAWQRPAGRTPHATLSRHKEALGAGLGAGWCGGSYGPSDTGALE